MAHKGRLATARTDIPPQGAAGRGTPVDCGRAPLAPTVIYPRANHARCVSLLGKVRTKAVCGVEAAAMEVEAAAMEVEAAAMGVEAAVEVTSSVAMMVVAAAAVEVTVAAVVAVAMANGSAKAETVALQMRIGRAQCARITT